MSTKLFNEAMKTVINALKKAGYGYDPYEQLYGYVSTGTLSYITRQDNARSIVAELDMNDLRDFLNKNGKKFM